MIITRSPLRISLGGGGTDLPSYYREHGGFVLSAAIDKYVYITLHETFQPEFLIKYSATEVVQTVDEIKHPIIREALRMTAAKVVAVQFGVLMAGATGGTVDIYRNNALLVNTANDGAYTDSTNAHGHGSFTKAGTGSSNRIVRAMLTDKPPSLDAGEATDKGSINQRMVLRHRAALVDEIYADQPSARVISGKGSP